MSIEDILKVQKLNQLIEINYELDNSKDYNALCDEILILYKELILNQNVIFDRDLIFSNNSKSRLNIYLLDDTISENDILKKIKNDNNKKILISDNFKICDNEVILKVRRSKLDKKILELSNFLKKRLANLEYSEIHLICYDYVSYTEKKLKDKKLFPIKTESERFDGPDYMVKGDVLDIVWNLVTFYVMYNIKSALSMSIASNSAMKSQCK